MIITTAIIKGGAGKTTTAAALLQAAVHDGQKCLAVDLDPQGNLSSLLAADNSRAGSHELLHGTDAQGAIQASPQGMDVTTGSPDLATETTRPGSSTRLKDALLPIEKDYDLIIIDTPPYMGELTYCALIAADSLLIPLETDTSSLRGLYHITDLAQEVQKTNKGLQILGTVITRYDARPRINRYLYDVIREKGEEVGAPIIGTIRQAIAVKEAQAMQQSLYDYAPKCKAALDYQELYAAIIKK